MTVHDFCKTCGGLGVAAFGNPATKTVSYYAACTTCNGIGWSPEAIVRDKLDPKAMREALDFSRAKVAYQAGTSIDHQNLGNFQKYLDYLKANGKWDADLLKSWEPVSPRSEYEPG